LTSSINLKGANFLVRSLLYLLFIITLLMLSLYVLTLFFYKLDIVIPQFLNFNLINITFIFFSLTNSNLLSSKDFVDFLSLVTKANYNNLNESHSSLSIQQKYFLKHESTYFTDKKCSETWIDGFYLPSEEFFYAKSFWGTENPKKSINLLEFSTHYSVNNLNSFESELANRLENPSAGIRSPLSQYFFETVAFERLKSPQEPNPFNIFTSKGVNISPLYKTFALNLEFSKDILWEEVTPSRELFEKDLNTIIELDKSGGLYFFRNQINLNKFFIESKMYMFSGIDWIFFYFLPLNLQKPLILYSDFIKWILAGSSSHNFYENKSQIDKVLELTNLSEISPLKLSKKL
jgi:hypothetical protein